METSLKVALRTLIQFPFAKKPQQSYAFTIRKVKNVTTLCDSLGITKAQLAIRLNKLVALNMVECHNINDISSKNTVTYRMARNKETLQFINNS